MPNEVNTMKKLISIILSIVIITITSSCNAPAPKIDDSDEYIEGQDAQESNFGYQMHGTIPETDDSFYLSILDTFYVVDKNSHKMIPMCSKPDCKHDKHSRDCEAHDIGAPILYMGKLYYVHMEYKKDENGVDYPVDQICSMNLEGTDKKVVFETKKDTFMISTYKIHRGYFYLLISNQSEDGSYSSKQGELCRIKIGGSEKETIMELSDGLLDVRFYGNNMFILHQESQEGVSEENYPIHFDRYDIRTLEHDDLNERLEYPVEGLFTISRDKIIYTKNNDFDKLCVCGLDGNGNRIVTDLSDTFGKGTYDYYSVLSSNDDSILITASCEDGYYHKTMILCDAAMEHFESYDLPTAAQPNIISSGDMMIFFAMAGKDYNGSVQVWLADKTKLGQEDCMEMLAELEI